MPRPDVFLSYASADKESVETIALQLRQNGIPIWLDRWNLVPGQPWMDALGQALQECSGCIVFLGPGGPGPWHDEEVRMALDLAARNGAYRLVPVLLPGARREKLSRLPKLLATRTWVKFSKQLDEPEALHRLVCGIRGVEPGPPPGSLIIRHDGPNPYRGLRFFDVEDAPLFFGREALTQELLDKLRHPEPGVPRFISIVGPSGSGKSSLARAGLLASLRRGELPGSAQWPQVIIRPGQDPLGALCAGVMSKLAPGRDPGDLVRRLQAGEEEGLHRQVKEALQHRPDLRLVLLIDQAEEAFTRRVKEEDRRRFFENLACAATVGKGQTLVVLAFRADFYARFAEYQQLAALVSENQQLVSPMTEPELREAIALPAARSGRSLRPSLVDELLADAKGRPASLPLLEHALEQLWELPEPALDVEQYRFIGRLAGALDARAERLYGSLTPPQQATCRRLFLRLVQPSEDVLDTRRRISGSELPADQREVSRAFANEDVHLLVWSGEEGAPKLLEIAHEELIRSWGRLQRWIDEDRLGQRIHRRLMAASVEWNDRGRDGSYLYRGSALVAVEEWLERLPQDERANLLNQGEQEFLDASRAARDRYARRSELTARRILGGLVAALVIIALTAPGVVAIAMTSAREATRRELLVQKDPREAEGRAALGHACGMVYSPDGLRVLTASRDPGVRIWDAASGRLLAELGFLPAPPYLYSSQPMPGVTSLGSSSMSVASAPVAVPWLMQGAPASACQLNAP